MQKLKNYLMKKKPIDEQEENDDISDGITNEDEIEELMTLSA